MVRCLHAHYQAPHESPTTSHFMSYLHSVSPTALPSSHNLQALTVLRDRPNGAHLVFLTPGKSTPGRQQSSSTHYLSSVSRDILGSCVRQLVQWIMLQAKGLVLELRPAAPYVTDSVLLSHPSRRSSLDRRRELQRSYFTRDR